MGEPSDRHSKDLLCGGAIRYRGIYRLTKLSIKYLLTRIRLVTSRCEWDRRLMSYSISMFSLHGSGIRHNQLPLYLIYYCLLYVTCSKRALQVWAKRASAL